MPKLRWRPGEPQYIVKPADQDSYPAFADDFAVLERELMPVFREVDNAALRHQNTFYLVQLAFSVGAVLATVLGALQAAIGGGQLLIAGFETTLSVFLGAGALVAYSQGAQRSYYTKRLQAERLRSEYFLFLGRLGPYGGRDDRVRILKQRVDDIRT